MVSRWPASAVVLVAVLLSLLLVAGAGVAYLAGVNRAMDSRLRALEGKYAEAAAAASACAGRLELLEADLYVLKTKTLDELADRLDELEREEE